MCFEEINTSQSETRAESRKTILYCDQNKCMLKRDVLTPVHFLCNFWKLYYVDHMTEKIRRRYCKFPLS